MNQYTTVSCLTPSPAYDDDGNMTQMPSATGSWTLTWDGENRLISAESATARLEFRYDYMSRRVEKRTYSGTPGNWTLDETSLFLYDGWNLILERRTANQESADRIYTWGLDLSQTLQSAGGVGGLLSTTIHDPQPATYVACYDANGNVSEYFDANGAIAGHYEYDPFGCLTAATGIKAADFTHRLSTKYLDVATGLYWYGYRYYSTPLGRWASRDPVGERCGPHLLAMAANSPTFRFDPWGLASLSLVKKKTVDGIFVFATITDIREGCRADFVQIKRPLEQSGYTVDKKQYLGQIVPPKPPFYYDIMSEQYLAYRDESVKAYNASGETPLNPDSTWVFTDGPTNIPDTHFMVFVLEVCCDPVSQRQDASVLGLVAWMYLNLDDEWTGDYYFWLTPSVDAAVPSLRNALLKGGYGDAVHVSTP